MRPDPAGRAFYSLLKCAAEGLSARRFSEYLSLSQVPDADPSGLPPEATGRGVRVTDHKTGKADGKRGQIIAGGKSLQPLLYALTAEKLFADQVVTSGRLYFCTSTGGFAEQVVPLDEGSREVMQRLANTVGEALSQPFLPAAPDIGECDFCDYREVCGPHEERRTARKNQRKLEPLLEVRTIP